MYVEIGTEAAQFPEKEYINGISLAVRGLIHEKETCGRKSRDTVTLRTPQMTDTGAPTANARRTFEKAVRAPIPAENAREAAPRKQEHRFG
jgi:hypothetical protein